MLAREVLLKGRLSTVDLRVLTCLNSYFLNWNYYLLFYKTSCLNEEVNCTKPSPLFSFPWLGSQQNMAQQSNILESNTKQNQKKPWDYILPGVVCHSECLLLSGILLLVITVSVICPMTFCQLFYWWMSCCLVSFCWLSFRWVLFCHSKCFLKSVFIRHFNV